MRLKYEFKWFSAYILEIQSRLATETIAEWIACKTKRPTFVKQWHLFSTATCTCILFLKLMSYPFHLPYAHQQRHNVFESVACVQYCVFAFVSFICGRFEVVVVLRLVAWGFVVLPHKNILIQDYVVFFSSFLSICILQ